LPASYLGFRREHKHPNHFAPSDPANAPGRVKDRAKDHIRNGIKDRAEDRVKNRVRDGIKDRVKEPRQGHRIAEWSCAPLINVTVL
jgi:hypothetical protein